MATTCSDGKLDGSETDVDCGGGCPPCADGRKCAVNGDCASGGCSKGLCCGAGTGNCDGNAGNGCETNLLTSAANCGTCGNACPNGMPVCINGGCSVPTTPVTYSVALTGGVTPSQTQCDSWNAFRAQLIQTYSSVTLKGTNDMTGASCTGPAADTICQAIAGGGPIVVACNGRGWAVDTCGGGIELSASTGNCQCDNAAGYTLRPCVGSPDWGGVNTATCSPPSQLITVTCQ
jgi:hypothetical protein